MTASSALAVAARLGLAGLLGGWIALVYRFARATGARHPGLLPTLVLLAMLITLVTMAVGSNVAVAFTLVGTLAIVRFRTTVSDVRDTSFVIFAVAVGIAVGQSVVVALVGVALITVGIATLVFTGTLSGTGRDGRGRATLELTISPPSGDPTLYRSALERHGIEAAVCSSRVQRDSHRLRLVLACSAVDLERGPELVTSLLERPEVVEAVLLPD